jgi:flagellar protein FlgJ
MKPLDFVNRYRPFALETEKKKGIHQNFTLAQAAIESSWGESAPGNMFFGLKAGTATPENKRQLLTTTEVLNDDKQGYRFPQVLSITKRSDGKYTYRVKDWFRKYDTPEECFSDHADFFYKNKRYAEALKVKHDPYLFADAIAKAGYATAPNYASTLKIVIKTIEKL